MALPLQIETVRPYLNGQWLQVLAALVPELDAAIARKGRHVACPVHGGRDGFRLFKDAEYTGGGVVTPAVSFMMALNCCLGLMDGTLLSLLKQSAKF
ncbi:primase-helicase zinc-binding domain-containing protein [Shewanella halifaxensis]|uniref:primase-helicase zinc-binding domain-containing protein n=1 Tax=Shewanella halifaxensis TaxID=271098 RepID=UPI003FA1C12F